MRYGILANALVMAGQVEEEEEMGGGWQTQAPLSWQEEDGLVRAAVIHWYSVRILAA